MRLICLTINGFHETCRDPRIFLNATLIYSMVPMYDSGDKEFTEVCYKEGSRYRVVETCEQINKLIDREIERTSMYYNAMG